MIAEHLLNRAFLVWLGIDLPHQHTDQLMRTNTKLEEEGGTTAGR
jgi:hypothetical protein